MDFTLKIYKKLLVALKSANYDFITFEQFCSFSSDSNLQSVSKVNDMPIANLRKQLPEKFVILRHDVDLQAKNSLETARIEHELEIKASYYFRVVAQSNKPQIIKQIAKYGHEIGYHYEDLSLCKGDENQAIVHFEKYLNYFRIFYPVRTVCMHGSPISKIDNRNIWKSNNYRDFGIVGEPYFDIDFNKILYLTDTGRTWDGERFSVRDKVKSDFNIHIKTTEKLIKTIENQQLPNKIMITTHPQRWTDNRFAWAKEFILQSVKNIIKRFVVY